MAYGITPENEHHLVAQRDVRQFQVDAELNLGCVGQDVVGSGWLFPAGCPQERSQESLDGSHLHFRAEGEGGRR